MTSAPASHVPPRPSQPASERTAPVTCAGSAFTTLALAALSAHAATAGVFPPALELASLKPENGGDGRAGFVLRSSLPGSTGGDACAAIVGDLNGDGIADLVLGAPDLSNPGVVDGAGFVLFGRTGFPARVDLDALTGATGFRIDAGSGDPRQSLVGSAIAGDVDFNGDGASDLLIASDDSLFAVFGHAGGAADFPARLDLGALDGTNGLRIDMGRTPDANARIDGIDAAGDLDGDGIDDVFASNTIWQATEGGPFQGAVHAIFGRHQFPPALGVTELDGSNGFSIFGDASRAYLGSGGLSARHDFDGDGRNDLVLAEEDRHAIVLYGRPGPFAAASELPASDGDNGFTFIGGTDSAFAIAAGADVNGDGRPDLAFSERVNSYPGPWRPGRTLFVVYGNTGGHPALLSADDLDGNNGFRYQAEPDADLAGANVAMIGDINGDGVEDLAIHSERIAMDSPPRSVVHVIYGSRGGFPAQMDESILDGERGFLIHVSHDSSEYANLAGGGDINADGVDDMVIALDHSEDVFSPHAGDFAYVVYGREQPLFANGFEWPSTPRR